MSIKNRYTFQDSVSALKNFGIENKNTNYLNFMLLLDYHILHIEKV